MLSDDLKKLKPLPSGARFREVVTRERLEAIQSAILRLAQGENLMLGFGLVKGLGMEGCKIEVNRAPTKKLGVGLEGPFYTMYVAEDKDVYLQGGTVTGGNGGTATIDDEKVLDDENGVDGNEEKILFLRAKCKATIVDGLMMPGCELLEAELLVNNPIPQNHSFTVEAPEGYLYYEIGRWTETEFLRNAPGHFLASGCIGNFSLQRI